MSRDFLAKACEWLRAHQLQGYKDIAMAQEKDNGKNGVELGKKFFKFRDGEFGQVRGRKGGQVGGRKGVGSSRKCNEMGA